MNEWKQQRIDNGNDDQMKEETLDLWNEEFQHQIDDDQKKKNEITDEVSNYETNEIDDNEEEQIDDTIIVNEIV